MYTNQNKIITCAEIAVIYLAIPLLFFFNILDFSVMFLLMPIGIVVFLFLRFDKSFDNKSFTRWQISRKQYRSMWFLFVISAVVMLIAIWLVRPDRIFFLLRQKPLFLFWISLFYPVFSVIPQALAYRVLFFHRYANLFKNKWIQILVSAVFFSFGHVVFKNSLVLVLTFVAGIIYAYHYYLTKSMLFSIMEHSIYGVWLFASGLGMFFVDMRV